MPISRAGAPASSQAGFTYVMVLAAVVVVGILAEVAVVLTSRTVKSERETELLFRGTAYRNAIRSFYEAGSPVRAFPRRLEDLLNDPRFPNRHHLRALYPDPMSPDAKGEWLLIRAPDGGIAGVASSSKEEPLKKGNFPMGLEQFTGARTYADWVFEYQPAGVVRNRPITAPLR